MKRTDEYLQRVRIRKAAPFICEGDRILDIGSGEGPLFKYLKKKRMRFSGTGLDPEITDEIRTPDFEVLKHRFPHDSILGRRFNVITALAVLEHIPQEQLIQFANDCSQFLENEGLMVITVPSPLVDHILKVLIKLRILDGMEVDQHHGYDTGQTIPLFQSNGFVLLRHRKFQFGLNNLFVFQKKQPE
jgi:2-polyprenyl-3-methyl-5-hydroxy-6-metoxy-1,4-benzoquinol methylase